MGHVTLADVRRETNGLLQNRKLYDCLRDDDARAALYADLAAEGFPVLDFKSVLREGGDATGWPSETVYLLTSKHDVAAALQQGSVQPYAALDSGGDFMLGLDEPCRHAKQRAVAVGALAIDDERIGRCVAEAVERAMVLPQKSHEFDLVTDVAEQAALRFVAVLFGLPAKAHVQLERAMRATYTRLSFQIIGRHFVPDDGLPPVESEKARELKAKLEDHVFRAARVADKTEWWDEGLLKRSVTAHIGGRYGTGDEMTKVVALGLMAGTVGNLSSAITNTIHHFFSEPLDDGWLIDHAARLARRDDQASRDALNALIRDALAHRPPAPFLTRTAKQDMKFTGRRGVELTVPRGAPLLLAMGADVPVDLELMFGGHVDDTAFMHNCVGRHLAWPLIYETVRQVLALPGLSRVVDPATGDPKPPVKRWGAICDKFPLHYQRDRRLNQQPLFVVLRIKAPVAENAAKLEFLTRAGAPVVERALAESRNVHFAWFGLIENKTHLAMFTVYDGDFYAYVEHFALKVPLFDEQFKYLEDAPPLPIREHPKEFVDTIRKYNRSPLGGYFYSAYPRVAVADVHNAKLDPS